MAILKKSLDSVDTFDTEHTAGTWRVGDINHEKHRAYVYADRPYPRSVCVAEVRTETILDSELLANANLIAAAPELLDLIERAMAPMAELADEGGERDEPRCVAWMEEARAVVAKAHSAKIAAQQAMLRSWGVPSKKRG